MSPLKAAGLLIEGRSKRGSINFVALTVHFGSLQAKEPSARNCIIMG